MVHGELGGSKNIEVVSFSGSCCTGGDALKYACMAVELDPTLTAISSASERLSPWMSASYFQKESEHLSQLEDQPRSRQESPRQSPRTNQTHHSRT